MRPISRRSHLFFFTALTSFFLLASCSSTSADSTQKNTGRSTTASVSVDDTDVAYDQIVVADAPKTVLFLHGASFTKQNWAELNVTDTVADAGYTTVAIDLPGFGDTPAINGDRSEFLTDLLAALDLETQDVVIVSPSMSGSFVLPFLDRQPPVDLGGLIAVAPVGIDDFTGRDETATIPALLTWAENDNVVSTELATTLQTKLPGSQIQLFDGDRHAFYTKQPEAFSQSVIDFVASL